MIPTYSTTVLHDYSMQYSGHLQIPDLNAQIIQMVARKVVATVQ